MSNLQFVDGYVYTLPANGFTAPNGQRFKGWSVSGQEKEVGDTITLIDDVTVVAIWEDIPVPTSLTASYNGTVLAGNKLSIPSLTVKLIYSDSSEMPCAGLVQYWYNGSQIQDAINDIITNKKEITYIDIRLSQ